MADQKRRNAGAEPISRHPLFPAIVALWVGAFFGLASIVISPSLVESLVLATGVHKIVPMATPPLGTTMRILLALGATGLGGVIGFVVARRMARPAFVPEAAEAPVDGAQDAGEQARPGRIAGRRRALALGAHDGVAAIEEQAPLPGRFEAEADAEPAYEPVREEAQPEIAQPQILNVSDLDGFDDHAPVFRPHITSLEIDTEIEDAQPQSGIPAWLDAESAWREPAAEVEPEVIPMPFVPAGERGFQQIFHAHMEMEDAEDDAQVPAVEAEAPAVAEEQAAPGFKMLPRLRSVDAGWDEPVEEIVPAAPAAPEPTAQTDVAPEPLSSRRIAEADLDDLSPVELLERLALAMAERRAEARRAAEQAAADAAAIEAASAPIVVEFGAPREVPPVSAPASFASLAPAPYAAPAPFLAPVIETGQDMQDTVVTPLPDISDIDVTDVAADAAIDSLPAALRPVPFGDAASDDDHAAPLPGYVPPRHIGLSTVPPSASATAFPTSPFLGEDADGEEEEAALQQGYSSLLNLSRHAGGRGNLARAIRFDEPASDFAPGLSGEDENPAPARAGSFADPSQPRSLDESAAEPISPERLFDAPGRAGPSDPESTERALRAALATLQRMSGAA